jgi:glycosyltransferase involved in cell wall biosynthesis
MRLAHVIYDLSIGGGAQFLADLASSMAAGGFEQRVWCIGPAGPPAQELQRARVPVTPLNKRTRSGAGVLVRLAGALRSYGPQAVMTHGEAGIIWGLPAAALAGIASRLALVYQNYPETRLRMAAMKSMLPLAAHVVAGSESVARYVRRAFGVPQARVSTVHCGIPVERFRQVRRHAAGEHRTLLSIGRMVPRKGHEVLMRAAALLFPRAAGVRVLLVGDGPCRPALAELARELGIERRVEFRGAVWPDTPVWEEADVFVFPSLVEPQGLVVLEAFACGVPVVASDVGGIGEMIEPEVSGLLVPPGDPAALASALERVLTEPGLAEHLAAGGLRRVRQFDIGRTAEIYAEILRRLDARSPAGRPGRRGPHG